MNITLFLAQIWGPIILALAIGIFVSRNYYAKMYHNLEKQPLAVLLFGMIAMGLGIIQIGAHNVWDTLPEVLITLLGFGLFLKGLVLVITPALADQGAEWTTESKLVPLIGMLALIIGTYLTWFAYLS